MGREEVFDQCAVVRREVVRDHADLVAARLVGNDISEERNQLCRRSRAAVLPNTSPVLVLKPAYAPQFNLVECVSGYLEHHAMRNYYAINVGDLARRAR
jgi:hypothetical protein